MPLAGLELLLPPPDLAQSILRVGNTQPSNTELKQHAKRDRPVVLQVDGEAPFGDIVRVVDECRAAGTKVYLAMPGR